MDRIHTSASRNGKRFLGRACRLTATAVLSLIAAPLPVARALQVTRVESAELMTLPAIPLPDMAIAGLVAAFFVAGFAGWRICRRASQAEEDVHRLEALLNMLDEGVAVCSGMQVVTANVSLCRMIEADPRADSDMMLSAFIPDADTINTILSASSAQIETQIQSLTGNAIDVEISARTIPHGGGQHRVIEIRDVRDRRATQDRVSFLAHHDSLTGLPNREHLQSRLAEVMERCRTTNQRCAVIWLDLDSFKKMNDVHGHAMGDAVLCHVADKLQYELPAGTLVARLGGDEFVVLCDDILDPNEARLTGQQLRRLLNRPLDIDGLQVNVGASIGVAVFPDDATSVEELLKNADLALYQAKAGGRGRCRHYTEALGRERQRHLVLSEHLRYAIRDGDIQAFFQPLVRATDFRVIGFEALGRWFHPEFGAVPPNEFVRMAEESGLISQLTDVIATQAIAALKHWPADVRVTVNVSPVQINAQLVDQIRALVASTGIDPHRLELEVTEDVLIKDFEQTATMFARLRSIGVQMAMDDFGAGFTSLGNLRRLNFDRIKIDRIFTADLPKHRRSAAIVRSILVLARELNLDVTVEGVETAEQFAFLCGEGCREIQGYLFSPPKPISNWTDPASLQFKPIVPAEEKIVGGKPALIKFGAHAAKRAS